MDRPSASSKVELMAVLMGIKMAESTAACWEYTTVVQLDQVMVAMSAEYSVALMVASKDYLTAERSAGRSDNCWAGKTAL